MTNLNISKNIIKKCTSLFHGTHVTCYIKFKLLYNFRIVPFFLLLKYKCSVYIFFNLNFKIIFWIFLIFIAFLGHISLISNAYFVYIFNPNLKKATHKMNQFKAQFVQNGPNGLKWTTLDWVVWMDWNVTLMWPKRSTTKSPPPPPKKKKEYNNNKCFISIFIYYIDFLNKFSKGENLKMLLWVIFFQF